MINVNDLTGKVYGQLTVISQNTDSGKENFWLCLCSCGKTKSFLGGKLTRKSIRSCGCSCIRKVSGTHNETRGGLHTKEYCAWARTKAKCNVPTHHAYKWYGARGIKICDRWMNSYENFLADIGRAPSPKHSLGRIDNDGDYEPSNCRWETTQQQANNTRRNRYIEYNGQRKTITQWGRELGIDIEKLRWRIVTYNWPVEKAFTTP